MRFVLNFCDIPKRPKPQKNENSLDGVPFPLLCQALQNRIFRDVFITTIVWFAALIFPITTLAEPNVAIIVDTSISMREAGMDPERSSLLVARLFSDIVPGKLAVIRLIELSEHETDLPSRSTGQMQPCSDDPGKQCSMIERTDDWDAIMREKRLGASFRRSRGDKAFKRTLEKHLRQDKVNSHISLAMRAAEGALFGVDSSSSANPDQKHVVIWLTDGKVGDPLATRRAVNDLRQRDTQLEVIVFGQGDPGLPRSWGIEPHQVDSPTEMMHSFTDIFRGIVDAPYGIDDLVARKSRFSMESGVDEAWVVVYGDASLSDAWLDGPSGRTATDYAADRWQPAGAYRVAYLDHPQAGQWRVGITGGGSNAAYAVIQRAALFPVYFGPRNAMVDIPITVVAGLVSAADGPPISDSSILDDVVMSFEWNGKKIALRDDGVFPDATAGDGRFSGQVAFDNSGVVDANVRVRSRLLDKTTSVGIQVAGTFRHHGADPYVDLGEMGLGQEQCDPFVIHADQKGDVPMELASLGRLPSGHELFLRINGSRLGVDEGFVPVPVGARFESCLRTSERAASSVFDNRPSLSLRVSGSKDPEHRVTIHMSWIVHGLSFLQRWLWLILSVAAVMVVVFIGGGFIFPHRFPRGLAVNFSPEWEDMDELQPQPITQWKGTGIGFYRNARAYLHPDYRLSGRATGALAMILATTSGVMVTSTGGSVLYRHGVSGDWEEIRGDGVRFSSGDIFRIGDMGPFFKVAIRA
uniref:VWFA domain-containing protein n=1 Tax=Candidatus Kentrum sp. DK TaxID=2126562 RepID=A0A450SC52_9GAMM|nr:MAG: hypothetical protein BECKDK2373C_GA0170839_10275 [Candidatus Kentron sp. DK]